MNPQARDVAAAHTVPEQSVFDFHDNKGDK
jgi:hypothetical protein